MLNTFKDIISRLESQRAAVDHAIAVLREVHSGEITESTAHKIAPLPKTKRVISPEGRKAIAEASKKRWAAVRKAAKKASKKAP
jgi:hypothetical protein